MSKEKRSEVLRVRVTPSLRQEIERAKAEQGSVVTISDWLFEAAEHRLDAIHISKQRIGRRVGNS